MNAYIPDERMNSLTEALLVAAEHPVDPANEIRLVLAEHGVCAAIDRAQIEADERAEILRRLRLDREKEAQAAAAIEALWPGPKAGGVFNMDEYLADLKKKGAA